MHSFRCLVIASLLLGTRAGLWRPQLPSWLPSSSPSIDDELARFEAMQMSIDSELIGLDEMCCEAGESKRMEITKAVSRVCSAGIQSTLVVGGAVLAFRLIPVLFGNPKDLELDGESTTEFLIEGSCGENHPVLPEPRKRNLITQGESMEEEKMEDKVENEIDNGEGEGKEGRLVSVCEDVEEEEDGGAVVVITRQPGSYPNLLKAGSYTALLLTLNAVTAAARREAQRLARPLLLIMVPPLVLLSAAWVLLIPGLARRVDPEEELLFGDDILRRYSDSSRRPMTKPLPSDPTAVGPGYFTDVAKGPNSVVAQPTPSVEIRDDEWENSDT